MASNKGEALFAGIVEARAAAFESDLHGFMNAALSNGNPVERVLMIPPYFAAVAFMSSQTWLNAAVPVADHPELDKAAEAFFNVMEAHVKRITALSIQHETEPKKPN